MRNDDFIAFLRYIKLPRGVLLSDGTTYRLERNDFPPRKFKKELSGFEKILVLSNGHEKVVGGVLFYGPVDLQVTILPEYRGQGFMSLIHRNGILKSELYPEQNVSIEVHELRSYDDFLLRDHMLRCVGLRANNLDKVYRHLKMFNFIDCDEESFIRLFS